MALIIRFSLSSYPLEDSGQAPEHYQGVSSNVNKNEMSKERRDSGTELNSYNGTESSQRQELLYNVAGTRKEVAFNLSIKESELISVLQVFFYHP